MTEIVVRLLKVVVFENILVPVKVLLPDKSAFKDKTSSIRSAISYMSPCTSTGSVANGYGMLYMGVEPDAIVF